MDQNEVNSINSDLIRGHIDTIILKALQAGDRYGYDIIKEIEHKSDGQYIIKQPTLYSCLKRLEVQGFVKSYWGSKSIGGRKKYFTLTDMGRELFMRNKNDWDYSRSVIDKLISDDDYSAYESYDEQDDEQNSALPQPIEDEAQDQPQNVVFEDGQAQDNEQLQAVEEQDEPTEGVVENEQVQDEQLQAVEEQDEPTEEVVEDGQAQDNEQLQAVEEQDEQTEEVFEAEQAKEEQLQTVEEQDEPTEEVVEDGRVQDEQLQAVEEQDEPTEGVVENEQVQDEQLQAVEEQDEPTEEVVEDEQVQDDEDLRLSAAEQDLLAEESSEDTQDELLNKIYDEESGESYITNVGNSKYEPPLQSDEIYSAANYFNDVVDEEDEFEDKEDEVAASSVDEISDEIDEQDSILLPPEPEETESREYTLKRVVNDANTVFYSYKNAIPETNERAAVIDKEYRGVIAALITKNIVFSKPQPPIQDTAEQDLEQPIRSEEPRKTVQEVETESIKNKIVADTGDNVNIRTYNNKTVKEYNNKHYYYSNQLRLMQCGILFGIMILEIIMCFFFIEAMHNNMNITSAVLAIYIVAVVMTALFPIIAFFMASTDYYKRKRINYSLKNSIIFSIVAFLLVALIILFVNIYAGLLIGNIDNYLSSLIMPIVLSTNIITNMIIFHLLYRSGKYNLEE